MGDERDVGARDSRTGMEPIQFWVRISSESMAGPATMVVCDMEGEEEDDMEAGTEGTLSFSAVFVSP